VVGGSYAFALHAGFPARAPNDLDVSFSEAALLDEMLSTATSWAVAATSPRAVRLFSGGIASSEVVVLAPDLLGSGGVADRFACQFVFEDELSPAELTDVNKQFVNVEALAWVIGKKLHALWKERASTRVSTRSRDLFDLQIAIARANDIGFDAIAAARCASSYGPPRASLGDFPPEWHAPWREMSNATGIESELADAWASLRGIVEEWRGLAEEP